MDNNDSDSVSRGGPQRRPPIVRFMGLVERSDGGCWLWTGATDRDGYGVFTPTHKEGYAAAHRWSYEFFIGEIPADLQSDHLCRVRHCVNPFHIEPVTPRENTMRSAIAPAAINARKTHCKWGHPFSGDNLRIDKSGKRVCKTCARAAHRRWKAQHNGES